MVIIKKNYNNNLLVKKLNCSGLEPMLAFEESNFINIGERCNVAGSTVFKKHIMNDNFAVSSSGLVAEDLENTRKYFENKCHVWIAPLSFLCGSARLCTYVRINDWTYPIRSAYVAFTRSTCNMAHFSTCFRWLFR